MTTESRKFTDDLGAALGAGPAEGAPEEQCAALAQTMLGLYRAGNTSGFHDAFAVVERYVIFGSEEEQRLVIVGFLESLKNLSVWTDMDYAVFEEWIQPETYQAWRWLEKHWQGRRSLASAAEGTSEKLYIPPKKES